MKKILLVIPDISNCAGSERVNANLANHFSEKNQVTILTQTQINHPIFFQLNNSINVVNLNITKSDFFKTTLSQKIESIFIQIRTYFKIQTHFFNNSYDTVIGLSVYLNWILPLCKKNNQPQVLLCEHRDYNNLSTYFKILRRITYKKANSVIVLTKSQERHFHGWINNISVIPNYTHFKTPKCSSSLVTKNKLIFTGRLDPEKRVDWLLEAFITNSNINRKYELIIAGDGVDRFKLETKFKHPNVKFLGFIENIEELLEDSVICILPSKSEAFPLSILEAMSKGVPSIGFNVPGVRDIIINDQTGIIINDQSIVKLSTEIEKLLKDLERTNRLSIGCIENIRNYRPNKIFSLWNEII